MCSRHSIRAGRRVRWGCISDCKSDLVFDIRLLQVWTTLTTLDGLVFSYILSIQMTMPYNVQLSQVCDEMCDNLTCNDCAIAAAWVLGVAASCGV